MHAEPTCGGSIQATWVTGLTGESDWMPDAADRHLGEEASGHVDHLQSVRVVVLWPVQARKGGETVSRELAAPRVAPLAIERALERDQRMAGQMAGLRQSIWSLPELSATTHQRNHQAN